MPIDPKEIKEEILTRVSADDKERKEKILSKAEEMFLQHGYSKVTMEEIASNLTMSKKTLYRFFANKKDLLRSLMTERQCEFMDYIDGIWKSGEGDFIDKFRRTLDFVGERSSKMNKFHDIQRVEPELWKDIHDFKKGKIYDKVRGLLEAGFAAGVFRTDIDREILILVYMNAVESIVNPETLSELPLTGGQAFEEISKIIFEGILSEEGRVKYNSYLTAKKRRNMNGGTVN